MKNSLILYQGYVDDPRNTDNAWMETTVAGILLTKGEKESIILKSEDSEHNTDSTKWLKIDQHSKEFDNLYADHKLYLLLMESAVRGIDYEKKILRREQNKMLDDKLRCGGFILNTMVALGFAVLVGHLLM